MTESRSRLGLGLNNYSPQSEQPLDMYYNSRPNPINEPPSWGGYKPPAPPSQQHTAITEQPTKAHQFAPSHAYFQNAGTLESLAEKVHSFYPGGPGGASSGQPSAGGQGRRMSTGTGHMGGGGGGGGGGGLVNSHSHMRFPRSGSDQHLPRVEYSDFQSLGRQSLLRSSLKTATVTGGGTLGRYGRYDAAGSNAAGAMRAAQKYGPPAMGVAGAGLGGMAGVQSSTLSRRSRPNLDYSSDTEATIGARPSYYYYNRSNAAAAAVAAASAAAASLQAHHMNSIPRGSTTALGGGPEMAKFNSLPRDRPGARIGLRTRMGDRLTDDSDGALSAPEMPGQRPSGRLSMGGVGPGGVGMVGGGVGGVGGGRMTASPSIFTSDEYRAWLRRAPSSSAICEQMRASRDILNQQRAHRFSCSAENIHDALKNVSDGSMRLEELNSIVN